MPGTIDCKALFDGLTAGGSFSTELDQAAPDCVCENCVLSGFGPVDEGESLLRIVIAPTHIDKKKRPKAAVFTHAETIGMSCFRSAHATDAELIFTANELTANSTDPKAGVFGVVIISKTSIKAVVEPAGTGSSYCIYDTELPQKPAHADVCQRVAGAGPDIHQGRRQALLRSADCVFVPVSQFRNGILMPYKAADAP